MKTTVYGKNIEIPDEYTDKLNSLGHPFRASYYERLLSDKEKFENEKKLTQIIISLVKEEIKAGEIMLAQINK